MNGALEFNYGNSVKYLFSPSIHKIMRADNNKIIVLKEYNWLFPFDSFLKVKTNAHISLVTQHKQILLPLVTINSIANFVMSFFL